MCHQISICLVRKTLSKFRVLWTENNRLNRYGCVNTIIKTWATIRQFDRFGRRDKCTRNTVKNMVGWHFGLGMRRCQYISKEGTRSSAVGNYNKKASRQLKNVEDIKNRRIGHQREFPWCNDDDDDEPILLCTLQCSLIITENDKKYSLWSYWRGGRGNVVTGFNRATAVENLT